MYFALFIVCVFAYVTFLGWCLMPLVRRTGSAVWKTVLRVTVGVLLLAANIFPPFALPLLIPVAKVGGESAFEFAQAVTLFARTLPIYVKNVFAGQGEIAHVVSIRYPIKISGVQYAPVVRTGCTERKAILLDKLTEIIVFPRYPTAEGGALLAKVGDGFVALDHGFAICSELNRSGRVDPAYMPRMPVVIIRGEADNAHAYDLNGFTPDPLSEDDIVIDPPVIAVEERPAQEAITLSALWPMKRASEGHQVMPKIVREFSPRPWRACVERSRKEVRPELDRLGHCKPAFGDISSKLSTQNLPSLSPEL